MVAFKTGAAAEASLHLPEQSAPHWLTEGSQAGKMASPAKADPKSCQYKFSLSSSCCLAKCVDRERAQECQLMMCRFLLLS